jgi:hypothetical protein
MRPQVFLGPYEWLYLGPYFLGLEKAGRQHYLVTERFDCEEETVDKRQHNRYRLMASVSFSWESAGQRVSQGYGQTRDCSTSGAFIVTTNKVPVGSVLQVNLSLPQLLAAGSGARLRMSGCVVRIEPEGFAAQMEMRPNSLMQGGTSELVRDLPMRED